MEARPNDHPHGQYINAYKLRVGKKDKIGTGTGVK
jgi:hypothetical protein